MTEDEFAKDLEALLATPAEAVKLMLRPRKEVENVRRMAVAAAEKPVDDEELTV
jgi:hypothetical protein